MTKEVVQLDQMLTSPDESVTDEFVRTFARQIKNFNDHTSDGETFEPHFSSIDSVDVDKGLIILKEGYNALNFAYQLAMVFGYQPADRDSHDDMTLLDWFLETDFTT